MNIDYSFKREVETLRALRRVKNPNVVSAINSTGIVEFFPWTLIIWNLIRKR